MAGNSVRKPRGPGRKFVPGTSGNPSGRPKNMVSITSELRRMAAECDEGDRRTRAVALAERIWKSALGGNERIQAYLIDRLDGKAKESIEVGQTGDALKLSEIAAIARRQAALIRDKAPALVPEFIRIMEKASADS